MTRRLRMIRGRALDTDRLPRGLLKQRLAFAQAIAADGRSAMFYKPGLNKGDGKWRALRDVVAAGRPYFVRLQTTVLAIDADDDPTGEKTQMLFAAMTASGLEPILLQSGPNPGRFHLLCRITDDTLRAVFAMKGKALQLDVRTTIRPPFAPHWLGNGCSFPIDPVDTEWKEALGRLLTVPPPRRRPLPPAMQRLLHAGK